MQGKRTWQIVLIMTLVVLWGLANRSLRTAADSGALAGKTPLKPAETAPPPPSPAEAVLTLQKLHAAHDYDEMAGLIVSDQRESFMRLIRAADAVIDSNARLKANAEARFGGPMGEAWDLSSMQNNLGPLSKDLRLINQRFRGDSAIVTLQEGDHVPLVRAVFRSEGGAWRYDPEAVPHKVVEELWQLAYLINDVDSAVRNGASFDDYFDSFMQRILPQMARVATVQDVPSASVASSVDPSE